MFQANKASVPLIWGQLLRPFISLALKLSAYLSVVDNSREAWDYARVCLLEVHVCDSQQMTCQVRDFVPPRMPAPAPPECAWRLLPMEADPSRDIYPGACLSVGLSATSSPQQDQQQPELARAYFVDVVVQDIYFSSEQTTRAKQALAEALEREEANGGRATFIGRHIPGYSDSGGPVEGLRPNCRVRAVRVMVLRSGGAANEFALVSGRVIYKLGYDLHTHVGMVRDTAASRKRQGGGARLMWAIPRALNPVAVAERGSRAAGAEANSVAANAKRWQYKTRESSKEWVNFPPFIVLYMAYDSTARYAETHPLLVRYLQPELDLSAKGRGVWRLCLPQYFHPLTPPLFVPHPSDAAVAYDKSQDSGSVEAGGCSTSAEGVVLLESPYARSSGGAATCDPRDSVINDEAAADASPQGANACEPPQPLGGTQNSAETAGRASVLSINHLASLLCSAGDSAPPRELLSKALPFFKGLLPHLGSQAADAWQLEVAKAAIRAADQVKDFHVDEQDTESEKLRRQGISFAGYAGGTAASATEVS